MPSIQAILVTSSLLVLLASPGQSLALSNAGALDHQANRRHAMHAAMVNSNAKMIKKRQGGGVLPRPTTTSESSPPAQATTTTTSAAPTTPTTTTTSSAPTTTSTSTSGGIIDSIISRTTTSTSATSTTSNTSSSSSSTTSTTSGTSQTQTTAAAPTITENTQAPPPAGGTQPAATTRGRTTSTIVSNVTASATATSESQEEEKPSQFGRNSIIAIAVIASCIGGAAAIWTLIRKWKLSPSSKFEDRMNPIEWSPGTLGTGNAAEKDAATNVVGSAPGSVAGEKHQRAGSTGSRGSVHSSAHEQDNIGRNVTGNGNMFADQDPNQVVPPHDFTAGPAPTSYDYNTNAGYVDLQRGNSTHLPGSGAGLARGPSVNHGYDYSYPPHDAAAYNVNGQYDYDNSHYATGGYGQPADLQRGPSLHRGQDAYAPDAYGAYDASQYPVPNDPYAQYNQNGYGQGGGYQQGRY